MQFPPQLADKIDPHRIDGRHADQNVLCRQPAKCLVGQIGSRNATEEQARFRPGQHQHARAAGQLRELHGAVFRHVLFQVIVIEALQRACRDQVERV